MTKTKVFVYGTLKKGGHFHEVLQDSRFIGEGAVEGQLYNLGAFPGLVQGEGEVKGELYELAAGVSLECLDHLEGFFTESPHKSLFVRKQRNIEVGGETHLTWVYYFNMDVSDCEKIEVWDV
jgi:gamma-glutamylcyclotransferase (GGCT)/AIG2-like uncharacterized protein YtfP